LGGLARVPLASGLLSGRYQDLTTFDESYARAGKYDAPTIARMQQEIEEVVENELPQSMTLPQYALTWSLSHPAVSCVIPGCKTPEHVRMNAGVADLALVDDAHPQALAT